MEETIGEKKKKLVDLTLLEIIELGRTANQIYGDGVFDSILGEEVKECLNALKVDQLNALCNNEIHQIGDEIRKKVGKMTPIDLELDSKDNLF